MAITHTHTSVDLEVSRGAFRDIVAKLKTAAYEHVFEKNADGEIVRIDMSGIALVPAPDRRVRKITGDARRA